MQHATTSPTVVPGDSAPAVISDVRIGWWVQAPAELVFHPDLDATAVRVFLALAVYADRDTGDCFPGLATLSERLGVSQDTVRRAIRRLTDAELVTVRERYDSDGGQRSNGYVLHYASMPTPPREDASGEPGSGPRESARGAGGTGARQTRPTKELDPREPEKAPVAMPPARLEAEAIVREWWEDPTAKGPRRTAFIGKVKVVEQFVRAGVPAADLRSVLDDVPAVSTGCIDMALARRCGQLGSRRARAAAAWSRPKVGAR